MTDEYKQIEKQLADLQRKESPFQKYIFQIITLVFLAGGGWTMLNSVSSLADENKAKIEAEEQAVQEIEKTIVRIETKQIILSEDVKDVKKELTEIDSKIDSILRAVQNAQED